MIEKIGPPEKNYGKDNIYCDRVTASNIEKN
jgi:hypothetical protein